MKYVNFILLITRMGVVTYLLGAGASVNAIPVVKGMAGDIINCLDLLNIEIETNRRPQFDILHGFIRDELYFLNECCEMHSSIDTCAKKFFLKGESHSYLRLKFALTLYFTIRQYQKPMDKRYDNFWASILSSSNELPEKIRIISWNYDQQLEMSFRNFTVENSLSNCAEVLFIKAPAELGRESDVRKFSVLKLNGSAKFMTPGSSEYLNNDHFETNEEFLHALQLIVDKIKENSREPQLSFAWETDLNSESFGKIKESLFDTTELVVVGYSFPMFNRKIDSYLINDVMTSLEKVYFQAPGIEPENYRQRFGALSNVVLDDINFVRHIRTFQINDVDQFYFPNSLEI